LLIDRVPRRKLILVTQVGLMLQAAAFGLLAYSGQLALWHIILLYFVFGALLAIDHPARRAFLVELVPADDLANAVALNATVFNLSSLIGYALAGFMLASLGAGITMLFNAASYLAPITMLLLIRVRDVGADLPAADGEKARMRGALLEGAAELLRRPELIAIITLMAAVGGLAYPVFGLMAAFAEEVMQVDTIGLGVLMAAGALGSVIGTFALSFLGSHRRGQTLAVVAVILPLTVALFSLVRTLWLSCLILILIGIALLIVQSLTITLVQLHIADRVRGRVMSIYSLLHAGSDTVGNVAVGTVAVWIGLPWALAAGAGLALCFAVGIALVMPAIRHLD
jgi:predicted MFS family arabinose efflux permease